MTGRRVIVVGGGLIGLSIARALTERGISEVLVLERHSLASGGTGKSSGIVRCHYGVPSIAAMAWRSLPTFERLGDEVGFRQVGYMVAVGAENEEAFARQHRRSPGPRYRSGDDRPRTGQSIVAAAQRRRRRGLLLRGARRVCRRVPARPALRGGGSLGRCEGSAEHPGRAGADVRGPHHRRGTGERRSSRGGHRRRRLGWWSGKLMADVGIDLPIESLRSELLLVDTGEPLRGLPALSDL